MHPWNWGDMHTPLSQIYLATLATSVDTGRHGKHENWGGGDRHRVNVGEGQAHEEHTHDDFVGNMNVNYGMVIWIWYGTMNVIMLL